MPADDARLEFTYQYVSNDSGAFENFFLAELETELGTFVLGTADNAAGSPAGGLLPPPPPDISDGVILTPEEAPIFLSGVNILGSTLFVIPSSLMTDRVTSSFSIPAELHATVVTLRFVVGDVIDTGFDSVVVIDGIRLFAADSDFDGVLDELDNCPGVFNPDQLDSDFNGLGDLCQTLDLNHSTAAFLQAVLDGSTTLEPTALPVTEEPPLSERLVRIVDFRIDVGLTESAAALTANLIDSLVDVGLVPPDEAGELGDMVLQQITIEGELDVDDVEIELDEGELEVEGSFTLSPASDGIDPPTEDVILGVGTFTTIIPAGSFSRSDSGERFEFEGVIDGVELEVEIRMRDDRFDFEFEAEGADLSGTANPVEVTLVIGNDRGAATVTAEIEDDDDDDDDEDDDSDDDSSS